MSTKFSMFTKAITIASIISISATLVLALLFGEMTHYKNGMDPKEFYSLGYEEQVAWRKENEISITGIEYFQRAIVDPYFKKQILTSLITWFFVSFISCLFMSTWIRKENDS